MRVRMVGHTDVGKVRKQNQDCIYFDEPQGIAIIADGIGGRKGGELASRMAVEGLKKAFLETDKIRHEEVNPFLMTTFEKINQKIISFAEQSEKYVGMGTTLVCMMFVGDHLHVAHIGDSRAYLYYKSNLWQLTIDHSVKTYVERGWILKQKVQPGTQESALVRSVGLNERCEVDLYDIEAKVGEIFIACSDGLTSMVNDRRIAAIVKQHENEIDKIPKVLVQEANRNGGKDNTSVVICQIGSK